MSVMGSMSNMLTSLFISSDVEDEAVPMASAFPPPQSPGSVLRPNRFAGWLKKKGVNNPAFQDRWFVLDGDTLAWYADPDSAASRGNPKGCVRLEKAAVLEQDPQDPFTASQLRFAVAPSGAHAVNAPHAQRTFVLEADTEDSRAVWLHILGRAAGDGRWVRPSDTELGGLLDDMLEAQGAKGHVAEKMHALPAAMRWQLLYLLWLYCTMAVVYYGRTYSGCTYCGYTYYGST